MIHSRNTASASQAPVSDQTLVLHNREGKETSVKNKTGELLDATEVASVHVAELDLQMWWLLFFEGGEWLYILYTSRKSHNLTLWLACSNTIRVNDLTSSSAETKIRANTTR